MIDNTFIGKKIRQIRKEKKITQKQLADSLGVHESSITKYEKGTTDIPLSKIEKIANALEVSPFEIIGATYFDNVMDIEKIKIEVDLFEKILSNYKENEALQLSKIIENFNSIEDKQRLVDYSDNLLKSGEYDLTARVLDDSMKPKYNKGDKVYIDFGYDFSVGDVYLIEYDNSIYIRKVFNDGYRVRLISLNEEYNPINIDIPIEKQFNIIGKVMRKEE